MCGNLAALFIYKYLDFTVANVNQLFGSSLKLPGIDLPIGISFYCFQCLSYLIDIYRGSIRPCERLTSFALYISFFPALIAGPIVRYIDVQRDLGDRSIRPENWYCGLQRFFIGLAKKVLIADPLGFMADQVMAVPASEVHIAWAWIGIICYAMQIYFDFSSYSDMAIGLGRVFNFHFLENFNYPYSAKTLQDFWRRWHISLSSWLRDYVYIPLGGSRRGTVRTFINVWIVFLLCGLWHGASWNFVAWGAWHGMGLTAERLGWSKLTEKFPDLLRVSGVFVFVLLGWVLFRTNDMIHAWAYMKALVGLNDANFWLLGGAYDALTLSWLFSLIAGVAISQESVCRFLNTFIVGWIREFLVAALALLSWIVALSSNFSPFIYFRF